MTASAFVAVVTIVISHIPPMEAANDKFSAEQWEYDFSFAAALAVATSSTVYLYDWNSFLFCVKSIVVAGQEIIPRTL